MRKNETNSILNELKGKKTFPKFIVLSFIILLLIIDFMPYFKSMEIINPQFLYLAFLNLIIGIYFYFTPALVSNEAVFQLKRSYIFKCYLLFLILCAISFFSAKNISLTLTKITEISIVFCLFINLTILLKNRIDLFYKIAFIVGFSAFLQSWEQLCHFIIIPKNTSIIDLLTNMKGNTGNINILSASLTIKLPFIILGISHFKSYKKLFLIFALFSVTATIFLTGSRTPLINIFLIYLIYISYILKENSFTRQTATKILLLILPVLCSILFANFIFEKSKDKSRYVSLENRISQINTQDESANARLAYWKNAITLIKKEPVTGIGLGNYQIESIPYERTISNDLIVSLHTHNDFLEIASETGILNGLVYIALFAIAAIINVKNIFYDKNKKVKDIALLTLMLIIIYGVDSLFNFPMYRPTMQIFFGLMLALTIINGTKLSVLPFNTNKVSIKILYSIVMTIAVATTYSAFLIYKASHLEYLIVTDDINNTDKRDRVLTGDEVVKQIPFYPNVFNTSESFYEYAGIYYIREKKYDKALKCFSKASKINPYTGRIEFYKQAIASKQGKIDSAYIYSKKAFYMRPRNYALYKTATLYSIENNDTLELLKEHKLFSQYRDMPETWIMTANVLENAGANYKRLVGFINQGLKKFPNDSTLKVRKNEFLITQYLIEGQDFENKSDLNNALHFYEKALKIEPKSGYISQNIGFNYFKQNQNKKAINALLEALKYPGLKDGKTEFFLGICYLKENDKANALKYFNLSKAKNYPPAKQLTMKMQHASIADMASLKKRKTDLLIADLITEGQKFEEKKEMEQALLSYEKALKIDAKNIYVAQNIGFYYLKQGQDQKAIKYLLNALKYPGLIDGKTEYFLSICYLKENDKTNACKYLTISKDKNYPDAEQLLLKICR